MEFAENILSLDNLSLYSAPADVSPMPYKIPEHYNLVELLTDGVVYFKNNNKVSAYRRGSIFWHVPGDLTISETTREEPYKCLVFRFKVKNSKRTAPRVSCWRSSEEALNEFIIQSHKAFFSSRNKLAHAAAFDAYCAAELLSHALKLKDFHALSVVSEKAQNNEIMLRNVILYIEKNIAADLSVDKIAAAMNIPRNRLFRIFRDVMQKTPHEYVVEKRLDVARRRLESRHDTIKEIASSCGFEHTEVFHRIFLQKFGESPGQYRKNHFPYHSG
ncbi:MAG: helix-turn-helix transcriptional regulator [Lentisphaeria bacterium]|nr:helix-turn-helix transcriptional regulator [Lentisphaeria bacterium]